MFTCKYYIHTNLFVFLKKKKEKIKNPFSRKEKKNSLKNKKNREKHKQHPTQTFSLPILQPNKPQDSFPN